MASPAPEPLLEVRPSWWNFVRHVVLFAVVIPILVVGAILYLPGLLEGIADVRPWIDLLWFVIPVSVAVPPIVAYLHRIAAVLRVYEDRITLERGILSKQTKELFIADVRSIDTRQSVAQRLVSTGDLMIASSGTDEYETVVEGVPRPQQVRDLIVERRGTGPPAR